MSSRTLAVPVFRDDELSAALTGKALVASLLREQRKLDTAATRFSDWHEDGDSPAMERHYRQLIPTTQPQRGEQYAFEVKVDDCTGCKACVAACHSLNGLDDEESWRSVGALISPGGDGYQQTITSACHHCEDPACANGCPVLAYEKDEVTGIVKHLDDQCIGCSYCILKCPYDVPKLNVRLGIVRKCDMCTARLAVGEAPACVQACPTSAIGIRIVPRVTTPTNSPLLPDVIGSDYTRPTTKFVSTRGIPNAARAADAGRLQIEHTHWPLVVMLVFTQVATGLFFAAAIVQSKNLVWTANGFLNAGLAASVMHLGQPLRAWRCFLGWRRSWLSREILVFGAFAASGMATAVFGLPAILTAIIGLVGVACSVMVYVDTRRPLWNRGMTALRFLGTTVIAAAMVSPYLAASILAAKLFWTITPWVAKQDTHASLMHWVALPRWTGSYILTALLAVVALPLSPIIGAALSLAAEMLERALFFKAVRAWRMPGI
ncbi:MAG: dimethyl sulfoxide reductase anchor subunit [Verrucomicrobiaceae bacterium]|nr:dimethyl sulfoxide reductase anchor subunit [Verrucomicrobiaceae bacterium]